MSQVGWGRSKNLLDFDLARTARNGLIGAMFGPLVHYYYDFSDWILPMDVPVNRIFKIIMDQTIYFVAKCSAYIALVGLLRGDNIEQVGQDVKERIWPVVSRGWRFWPLAHIVTYGVIPPRHRVLWVNVLDLVWSSILANLAAGAAPVSGSEGVVVGKGEEGEGEGGLREGGEGGVVGLSSSAPVTVSVLASTAAEEKRREKRRRQEGEEEEGKGLGSIYLWSWRGCL